VPGVPVNEWRLGEKSALAGFETSLPSLSFLFFGRPVH